MAKPKRKPLLPPGTPILDMNDPDFAAKFAAATGIAPGEPIEPQFHRERGAPAIHPPPEPFARVDDLTYEELRSLGCRPWDEPDSKGRVLLLFPGEWYPSIPAGYRVTVIDGRTDSFVPGETDDEIRYGCLAYGVLVARGRALTAGPGAGKAGG